MIADNPGTDDFRPVLGEPETPAYPYPAAPSPEPPAEAQRPLLVLPVVPVGEQCLDCDAEEFMPHWGHCAAVAAWPSADTLRHGDRLPADPRSGVHTSCDKYIGVEPEKYGGTYLTIWEPERGVRPARSLWANLSPRDVRELIDRLRATLDDSR